MSVCTASRERLISQATLAGAASDASYEIQTNPSDTALDCLYHVLSFGHLEVNPPFEADSLSVDGYILGLGVRGQGHVVCRDWDFTLNRGDMVWLECSTIRHLSCSEDWDFTWIRFDGPAARKLFELYRSMGELKVALGANRNLVLTYIKHIAQAIKSEHLADELQIHECLVHLTNYLIQNHIEHGGGLAQAPAEIKHAIQILADEFSNKLSLDDLSERVGMNKYRLSRIFHEVVGVTVGQYLTDLRIKHACDLLKFSNLPVSEVGELCGMPNASRFTMVFREQQGITPSTYRKRWADYQLTLAHQGDPSNE